MQVKKFEATTIAEALKLVKSELGPEAIILSTKNHRKGFGLLSKASVEVTAAVTDKALAKKNITEKVVPEATKEKIGKLSASKQSEIYDEFAGHYTRRYRNRMGNGPDDEQEAGEREAKPASRTQSAYSQSASANSDQRSGRASRPPRYIDIQDDDAQAPAPSDTGYSRNGRISAKAVHADHESSRIAQSRASAAAHQAAPVAQAVSHGEVEALQDDIQKLKLMLEELKSEQIALSDSKITESQPDEMHVEYQNLLRNGIDKRHASALVKQVSFALPRESSKDSSRIVESLAVEMMENLKIDDPLNFKAGSEQRVFALIGPTGVGKTTTIAKLASQAILQKNLRVGLINVDSYKVAALDQLATYAKILNVPFRQASNSAELDRALAEFKPLDLILIDTSGRSQRDAESLSQMRALLSECAAIRPLLIMSATTRDQELYDIITRFKVFNPTGLIFSKLDESATFGCIYNVAVKTGAPLTYFTVGQRVPEDLEPASRERVADLILDL
ncbi:MAG: flagellar biosynthesis protein FlhF [Bdellovibrionota bacterium]